MHAWMVYVMERKCISTPRSFKAGIHGATSGRLFFWRLVAIVEFCGLIASRMIKRLVACGWAICCQKIERPSNSERQVARKIKEICRYVCRPLSVSLQGWKQDFRKGGIVFDVGCSSSGWVREGMCPLPRGRFSSEDTIITISILQSNYFGLTHYIQRYKTMCSHFSLQSFDFICSG